MASAIVLKTPLIASPASLRRGDERDGDQRRKQTVFDGRGAASRHAANLAIRSFMARCSLAAADDRVLPGPKGLEPSSAASIRLQSPRPAGEERVNRRGTRSREPRPGLGSARTLRGGCASARCRPAHRRSLSPTAIDGFDRADCIGLSVCQVDVRSGRIGSRRNGALARAGPPSRARFAPADRADAAIRRAARARRSIDIGRRDAQDVADRDQHDISDGLVVVHRWAGRMGRSGGATALLFLSPRWLEA